MYLTDDFSEETTTWISRNGENGFEGQFETVFSPEKLDKLFIIHGGPGTGKSTMMKKISQEGVRTGARVEKVLCSSDPDSLDGVILCKNKKKVGIMDGTPPHGRLPKYPGCKEETVSLDRFWDASLLEKEKKRIPVLSKQKAQAYRNAYVYIRCAAMLHRLQLTTVALSRQKDKSDAIIKKILDEPRQKGESGTRCFRAFSMKGESHLPYDALPIQKATVLLGDTYSSELFLQSLYREAAEKGLAVLLLTSPYAEDIPDALYFYQERELFIKEEYAKTSRLPLQKGICLSAFGKDADSCSGPDPVTEEKNLLSLAFIQLRKAGEYHFALEEIYKKAMDYTALENYRLSLIPHILSYLE